ncbi:MAG: hypothetical protein PHU71_01045 [Candidatus Gracilibacteria bacterium]|nr:hypothetical protein [Candidatus Gracilibacteria bacterium]
MLQEGLKNSDSSLRLVKASVSPQEITGLNKVMEMASFFAEQIMLVADNLKLTEGQQYTCRISCVRFESFQLGDAPQCKLFMRQLIIELSKKLIESAYRPILCRGDLTFKINEESLQVIDKGDCVDFKCAFNCLWERISPEQAVIETRSKVDSVFEPVSGHRD